jgi:hypothetical protein
VVEVFVVALGIVELVASGASLRSGLASAGETIAASGGSMEFSTAEIAAGRSELFDPEPVADALACGSRLNGCTAPTSDL